MLELGFLGYHSNNATFLKEPQAGGPASASISDGVSSSHTMHQLGTGPDDDIAIWRRLF